MFVVFTYKKIFKAYLDCRKNKRKTMNALEFEIDFEKNLRVLLMELKKRQYKPGRSICFAVAKPKLREIFAADFRDRVVHHLLVNEIIDYSRRRFIFDSYACLAGKGNLKAVERLKTFIRQESNQGRNEVWYLKMDIAGFFSSIDQAILFEIFSQFIKKLNRRWEWKSEMLWLGKLIIFARCQDNFVVKGDRRLLAMVPRSKSMFAQSVGKGLPIGNYTSQFFANLYMNELDQFMKRSMRIKKYLRYVDDFVVIDRNYEKLRSIPSVLDVFLAEELKLKLSPKKTVLQPIENGIEFLGYFVKPNHVLVKKEVVNRLKHKLSKPACAKKTVAVVNSYFGQFKHANSYSLRKNICAKLSGDFKHADNFAKIF